jgi:beta-glucanase (GH16 family)
VPLGVPGNWTLTFQDEFNGNSLDRTKWTDRIDWWNPALQNDGGVQNYDIVNGGLRIWPELNPQGQFFWRHFTTRNSFTQTYGYFEARIKLNRGTGNVPAFWLYNSTSGVPSQPEIDIMEAWGGKPAWMEWGDGTVPTRYGSTMWTDNGNPAQQTGQGPIKSQLGKYDLSADFHVYGCKWDANGATFYFDGKPMDINGESLSGGQGRIPVSIQVPLFMILQLAFQPGDPMTLAGTPRGPSNAVIFDYVRAWK